MLVIVAVAVSVPRASVYIVLMPNMAHIPFEVIFLGNWPQRFKMPGAPGVG